jgi:hypothetical protein
MRPCLSSCVPLVMAAFLTALPAFGDEPVGPPSSAVPATAKSVTVFPVVLNSGQPVSGVPANMSKNLAELVGLLLERGGVKDVEISDASFSPPQDADLAKLSAAFAQFVQSQKVATEYALLGQFLGTPGKGVEEVRLVAVDRQGKVVLAERLDRQQLAQGGEEKVEPMIASYSLVRRLQKPWGLSDPNEKDAPAGKMAALWAEKSGLPPKSEQDAIQTRLSALKKTIKTSTVAVYPVRVSGKSDEKLAVALAGMLAKEGLGRAEAVNADLTFEIKPNSNQLRIVWDIARAFQEFLRKNPPVADYALLADYGIGRTIDGKTMVGGVQLILCDRKGDWALVTLRNSHQTDFQQINPQSPDDCSRLVVEVLKNDLR